MTSTDTTSTPAQGASLSAMRLNDLKSLAQQMGRISLSLRQIDENATDEETEAVDIGDIIKQDEAAAPAPAPKRQPCVRKGTERICE